MNDSAITAGSRAGIRAVIVPTRWRLWAEPPQYLVYWAASVAAAVALTVITAIEVPPHSTDLIMLGALAGLGIVQAEFSRQVERIRRVVGNNPHINLTSAWTFAGVLLLPPALTAALVAVLYGHLARRCWRNLGATPTYRTVSNGCRATLSCYVGYQVLAWSGVGDIHDALERGWASVAGIAWAIAFYFLVAAAIVIPGLKPGDQLFGGWLDNGLEALTLVTAVVVAFLLVSPPPVLIFGLIAVTSLLVLAHYAVLDKQLAQLGETDDTTGLFNTQGWYRRATEALTRAEREHETGAPCTGAILMIKIDDFKNLTNGYRRLADDAVLAAVATALRNNVSDQDALGRFTGAEFVVLLPDATEENAMEVAEQIRTAVAYVRVPVVNVHGRTEVILGMSVSISVVPYPKFGFKIHKLLSTADTELDLAKRFGARRNQVRLATTA